MADQGRSNEQQADEQQAAAGQQQAEDTYQSTLEGVPETAIPAGKGDMESCKADGTCADPNLPAYAGTVTSGYCADPAE
jgi:hypothetical protein